eukprot:CAMPEP_0172317736 /NCGR_PEP_ID=MMETSP1058-20130122/32556_1 /TAXON_ID=83371 /ORGANISM="Detonula confervacea, Strain CCMP 353" /LENGTH=816 /DNA_ID=CAMNT_0013032363 /DNA_START=241 /DNA_END=2691 /DNA_ORIENTATION=-
MSTLGESYSSIFADASDVLDEDFNQERGDDDYDARADFKIAPITINEHGADVETTLGNIVEEGSDEQGAPEVASVNESDGGAASNNGNIDVQATRVASENDHGGAAASSDENVDGPTATAKNENNNTRVESKEEESHHPTNETPKQPDQPTFKFQYSPLDFERDYYDKLFNYAQENKRDTILPPKAAASLFVSSGIPSDRLRMIWNMAVLPATAYPAGTKPPPAMTVGQFRSAVRLIQLFQNRVTAKDEKLRVSEEVLLAPAYFTGVSGVLVPLPWNELVSRGDVAAKTTPRRRHSASKMDSLTQSMNSQTNIDSSARKDRMRRSTMDSSSAGKKNGMRRSTISTTGEEKKWSPGENIQGSNTMVAYGAEDDYFMSQNEFLTYQGTFLRHCVTEASGSHQSEQHVYVDEAVRLFEKSGLNRVTLGRLWDVVVKDPDAGNLDEEEFVLMTHLIVCVTRRGLAVPTVLPAPLRIWRKNRFGGGQEQNHNEVEHGNGTHMFVPNASPSLGDKTSDTGNQASANRKMNNTHDEQRMKRMEREIQSLKKLVDSMRTEIQDLKEVKQRGSNGLLRRSLYDSTVNDDVPNVDVEMYWGEKKDQDASDRTGTSRKSSIAGMTKPPPSAPSSAPKRSPSLVPRHPPPSLRASKTVRIQPKKSVGVSQNIPPVHPSSVKPPRRTRTLHRGMPPPRFEQTMSVVPDDESIEVKKPITNGANNNLASQMQQVNREEKFDILMQITKERLGSESGSHTSSRNSRQTELKSAFKPATQSKKSGRSSRGLLQRSSLAHSARHITRRGSGEEEIYKTVMAPSTAAVDLPPLS